MERVPTDTITNRNRIVNNANKELEYKQYRIEFEELYYKAVM